MKKVIAVTGAFGALGSVVVRSLAAHGYTVAAFDIGPERAVEGAELVFGGVDFADPSAVDHAFAQLASSGMPLGGLVNIAGGFAWEKVGGGDIATWDRMYAINLRTAANACMAAIPLLSPKAAIINIGAMGALLPGAGMAPYAASKAGVAALTMSLAAELKVSHIQVNAILPSIIDTPANRRDMPEADARQWVSPESLAGIIAFLLSDAASSISGALIPVGGPA